jgi:hypothetical protein
MQIKTTLKFHLIPVRIATIKTTNENKCWWECGGKGTLYTVGGNVNQYSHYGKQYGGSSKN